MSSEDFKSLIVTDPDLIDEGIDVSNLRTQTDTNPRLLGAIEDYPGISYDPTSYSYLSDLNRLFASGLPIIDTSQPTTPAPPSGGEGGGGTPPATGGTPTPDNNAGFDPGVTPGPSGFIGLDPEYDVSPFEYDDAQTYEPPASPSTSDPFLASGAAGGARLPSTSPQEGFLASGAAGGANLPTEPQEGFLASGAAGGANLPTPTYANTGDPNLLDLAGGEAGGADGFGIIEDVVTEEDLADNTSLLEKLGLPANFDIKKAAIEAGINLVAGVPITLIAKALEAILPDRDPRQNALDEFYTTGEGAQYMNPSSPNYIPGMENYNTVSGNPLDPTFGLQEAYQDRIDTIENTLANKYGMTAAEIADVKAGSYTGDVDSDLLDRLVDLEDAKKKEQDILGITEGVKTGIKAADDDKGSDMLTTTPTGVNPFANIDTGVGEFDTTPVTGVTQPGTIVSDIFDTFPPDYIGPNVTDAELYGDVDTTPDLEFENIYEDVDRFEEPAPMTLADDKLNKMTDDVDLDDFESLVTPIEPPELPDETVTGIKGPPSEISELPDETVTGIKGPPSEISELPDETVTGIKGPPSEISDDVDLDEFDTVGSNSSQPTTTELKDSDFTAQDKKDIFDRERELENQYMEETGQVPREDQFLGQAIDEIVAKKTTTSTSVTPLEDDFESLVEPTESQVTEGGDEAGTDDSSDKTTDASGTEGEDQDRFEDDADEFSDEEFMAGDTSTAAPTTGDSGSDSFFDAVDTAAETASYSNQDSYESAAYDAPSKPATKKDYGPYSSGGGDGGNGGGGGGKSIVCTAMYQTTGLEDWSKAMKIWYIYQKKYLTIQHQEGYHKLFKPFVKAMHKSNIVKAIGAHFAKHRTQHLKHVMFNSKPSLLGKIYNKILEPLCYWVGKNAR
jgi:hypothetical protein